MNHLAVFKGKNIRRILHNKEWWFSIIDVVEALTESPDAAVYWRVLKHRLKEEGGNETVTKCNGLKMEARDGKQRETDCATAEIVIPWSKSEDLRARDPEKQKVSRLFVSFKETWIPVFAGMTNNTRPRNTCGVTT